MHAVKQTSSEDCLRAVLASLLHLPLEEVPTFRGPGWRRELNRWLAPLGLAYIQIRPERDWALELGIVGCHHELAGAPAREPRRLHAIVGIDGHAAFDPADAGGIQKQSYAGMFIALRPWEVAQGRPLVHSEKAA